MEIAEVGEGKKQRLDPNYGNLLREMISMKKLTKPK